MINNTEFWLSYNNGEEKIRLPVNPPSVSLSSPFENTDISLTHFGEITVIGERKSIELSFSSFLPAEYNETYCEYSDFPPPNEIISTIEKWRDKRRPIRFVITGTDVNHAVTIRNFDREPIKAGSNGDIDFSITLKEYRFLDVSAMIKDVKKPNSPQKERPPVINKDTENPNTYTVKSGDSLSKVFGSNWRKVYDANTSVIGNNPNLIYPGQKLVVPK